jgi:hypothetical protein
MNINNTFKIFKFKKEAPLSEIEIKQIKQLQNNRDMAIKLIPTSMKNEFLSSLYSDKILKKDIMEIYRNGVIADDKRDYYGKLLINANLSIHGFGIRLLAYHSIDPKDIADILLKNTSF